MYVQTYHLNPIQVRGKPEIKWTRTGNKEIDTKNSIKGKKVSEEIET